MKRLGVLTIGESPRPDMMVDLEPILCEKAEITEAGALDGLTEEQVAAMAPGPGDVVLVTRFNGRTVEVAERCIVERLQIKINELEAAGMQCILLLCTGRFSNFVVNVPFIAPGPVLSAVVPVCSNNSSIGVLVPEESQIEELRRAWAPLVRRVELISASPYGAIEDIEAAAATFRDMDIDLIVPDCMGYTQAIKDIIADISQKPVMLSRTLVARVVVEML